MQDQSSAPIILTAMMGPEDQSFFNILRDRHFPPERNYLKAHITLFHHLPPMHWREIKGQIVQLTAKFEPPRAHVDRLINLGGGVAFHVDSPDTMAIRSMIADRLHGLLIPQDQAKPRLHVTIQNKVKPQDAKQLFENLAANFEAFPIEIIGISAYYYRGGPWEEIGHWKFRK